MKMSTYEVSGFTYEPFNISFSDESGLDKKEIIRRAIKNLKDKEMLLSMGGYWNEREANEITRIGRF